MKLLGMRVRGYQAFADSGFFDFGPGINLIVGQNNSGKSSIIKALSKDFSDSRHREPEFSIDNLLPKPNISMKIEMSGIEIIETMSEFDQFITIQTDGSDIVSRIDGIRQLKNATVEVEREPGGHENFTLQRVNADILYSSQQFAVNYYKVTVKDGKYLSAGLTSEDQIGYVFGRVWLENAFYFAAQRYSFSQAEPRFEKKLDSQCRNLPAVLHTLMTTQPDLFDKLVSHMCEIFPTLGNISVGPSEGLPNMVEIRVWPTKARSDRTLSFKLDECGTGVGQTLSILSAIMTTRDSVILIDEINSYLHSGAVKSLLKIISSDYGNHQYIISTHASEVISSVNADKIFVVKKSGYRSTVNQIEIEDAVDFAQIAKELGISVTDVFSASSVVWVEGETEEMCFPEIYKAVNRERRIPSGIKFVSLLSTSEVIKKGRKVNLVLDIYRRLTEAASSILVSTKFSFDSEDLTDKQIKDITRSNSNIHFLPRRNIECYVLDAEAIEYFLKLKDGQSPLPGLDFIKKVIAEEASAIKNAIVSYEELKENKYLSNIDGARVLSRSIAVLSEGRLEFRKKSDTLIMIMYMIENKRSEIEDLVSHVLNIVDNFPSSVSA